MVIPSSLAELMAVQILLYYQIVLNISDRASIDIIIIMSCCWHGFPWVSLAIHSYLPSFSVGLLDYILCPYNAVVDKF